MRQSTYDIAGLTSEICERLSEGEPLRQICRDAHMPSWRTVYDWISKDEVLAAQIARARDLGYDAIAEEALAIADTPVMGERVEDSKDGKKVVREDMLGHRKLQIHTRLQLLAKWSPKKYGDKQQVEIAGQLAVSNMTEDEMRAELAALAASGVIPSDKPADDSDDISDLL